MRIEKTDQEIQEQISEALDLIASVLQDNVLGVYLYGSATLGGLQKYSDIDLFVVTDHSLTNEQRGQLVSRLLNISAAYPPTGKRRSIELTIDKKSELNPWKYPPSFDFQYGDWMREEFQSGDFKSSLETVNPDIAIIATQVMLSGENLVGLPLDKLMDEVPYGDFMRATSGGVTDLLPELKDDTRNVLLTLARIWHTLATDTISSKDAVAKWTFNKLPEKSVEVMGHAYEVLLGEETENWNKFTQEQIRECAYQLVKEVDLAKGRVKYDDKTKHISISM